jgi:hypothetical protein
MLPHSVCKISGYANVELFPFLDNIDPPGIQICPLKVVKPEYIESPPVQEGFLYNCSPGRNPAGGGTSASASADEYQMVNSDYVGTLPSELIIRLCIACLLFHDLISLSRDMASARV